MADFKEPIKGNFSDFQEAQKTSANPYQHIYEEVEKEKAARLENRQRYGIEATDKQFEAYSKVIAEAPDKQEASFKLGCARKISDETGRPLEECYNNIDSYIEEWYGDKYKGNYTGAWQAICDSFQMGKNNLRIGELGNLVAEATKKGDQEALNTYLEEYRQLQKENEGLVDNAPRLWATQAIEATAQTLPFMGAVAGAATFGNIVLPGLGGFAATTFTSAHYTYGEELLSMLDKGIDFDIANRSATCSSLLEGVVEAALDNVTAGIANVAMAKAGKALAKSPKAEIVAKVTNAVQKKFHFGPAGKKALEIATDYATNIPQEMLEEGTQSVVSDVAYNAAAGAQNKRNDKKFDELMQQVEDDVYAELVKEPDIDKKDLSEILHNVVESARGAFMATLITGVAGTGFNAVASSIDYQNARKSAEEIPSFEVYKKVEAKNPIFEQYTDEEKKTKAMRETWEAGQTRRDKKDAEITAGIKETTSFSEQMEEAPAENEEGEAIPTPAFRTDKGTLYTNVEEKTDEDGNKYNTFTVGNGDASEKNLYGFIKYTTDEDNNTVTIKDFKMAAHRRGLTQETFEQFAEAHAGENIVWNPVSKRGKELKNFLISQNASGKNNGLNYYKTQDDLIDLETRRDVSRQIKKYMPNLNSEQQAAAVSILEAGARRMGKRLYEYVSETFGNQLIKGMAETNNVEQVFRKLIETSFNNEKESNSELSFEDFLKKNYNKNSLNEFTKDEIKQIVSKSVKGYSTMPDFQRQVKAVIYAGEHADFSTFAHELAHVWQSQLTGDLKAEAEAAFNVKDGDWNNSYYTFADGHKESAAEAFARGFEDYLRNGKAPNEQLKNLFQKFAEFLQDVYRNLKNFINMSPEIENVYKQLMDADDSVLAMAEKAVKDTDREYVAKIKKQLEEQEEEKKQKKADEKQAKEDIVTEDEEITLSENDGAETDVNSIQEEEAEPEPVKEDESEKIIETPEELSKKLEDLMSYFDEMKDTEAETQAEIKDEAFEALETMDFAKADEVINTVTSSDPSVTITEKTEQATNAAGDVRDDEIFIFQLAGIEGVRNLVNTEERARRIENYYMADKIWNRANKGYDKETLARKIKQSTGWEKNASGQWVYETDDTQGIINSKVSEILDNGRANALSDTRIPAIRLSALYKNDELYEMYPIAKDFSVQFFTDKIGVNAFIKADGIAINTVGLADPATLKRRLVHEIQHIIQAVENFAEGNTDVSKTGIHGKAFNELWQSLQQAQLTDGTMFDASNLDVNMGNYMNNAAEIDARNVARRAFMSAKERQNSLLSDTADVKNENILFQTATEELEKQYNELIENKNFPENILFQSDKSLYGIHNLREDALRHVLKMGGLANPSMAVMDINKPGFNNFGEISLIPYNYMLEKGPGNKGTFGADIYSPRYPSVENVVTSLGEKKIKSILWAVADANSDLAEELAEKIESRINNAYGGLSKAQIDELGLQIPFLAEKGKTDFYKYNETKFSPEILSKFEEYTKGYLSDEQLTELYKMFETNEEIIKELTEENGNINHNVLMNFESLLHRALRTANKVDLWSTIKAAQEIIEGDAELKKQFDEYANEKYNSIERIERIFNGYTPSGNRKYLSHTLENVSKYMKQQGLQGGENFGYGLGSTRAMFTPKFTTLAQIKKAKDRLVTHEEFEEIKDKMNEQYDEICNMLRGGMDYDVGGARFEEAFTTRGVDPISYIKNEYDIDLTEEEANELRSFAEALRVMPTEYFETKFERPVYLNEFAAAVIPANLAQDLKDELAKAGLQIKEYADADSREEVTKQALREFDETRRILFQAKLADEVKADDIKYDGEFVLTSAGSKDFGEIPQEIGKVIKRQAGKIRLEIGYQDNEKKEGTGQKHIERQNRLAQLKQFGFDNARDFVEYVSQNYDSIYAGDGTSLILSVSFKNNKISEFIELKPNKENDYWNVSTGFIARNGYFKNKALLWTKPDNSALQSETGKTPTFQQMPPSEYFGIPDNSNNTLANDNLSNINFQKVYHGSGANFDKFNTDMYGLSGEGSMSFGYGTYLTDNEEIARDYAERQRKRALNKESVNPYDRGTLEYEMFEDLRSDSFNFSKTLYKKYLQKEAENIKNDPNNPYQDFKANEKLAVIDSLVLGEEDNKTNLYTVEIPDDGYLEWNKPVSKNVIDEIAEKYAETQNFANSDDKEDLIAAIKRSYKKYSEIKGGELYNYLALNIFNNDYKKLSLFLHSIGYAGIKYPAGTIHGNGNGAYNYVIFNDEEAKIVDHLLFQTQQELYKDAMNFDRWQEFMEYYEEDKGKPEISLVPEDADASWYRATWEMAKGITHEAMDDKMTEENMSQKTQDALFMANMSAPGVLEDFLKQLNYLDSLDFDNLPPAIDAEELAQREKEMQLKDVIRNKLRHGSWLSNATRVANGKELSPASRRRLLSLMRYASREYRDVYTQITGDKEFAVPEEESFFNENIAANAKKLNKLVSPEEAVTMSPEQLRNLADSLSDEVSNKEIAAKIKNGSLKMDNELTDYIKRLDKRIKVAENRYTELKKETEDDYKRIESDAQRRLLNVYDELLRARAKLNNKKNLLDKKIENGLKITEAYQKEVYKAKSSYDDVFMTWNNLIKATKINAEVQEAMKRKEEYIQTVEEQAKLQNDKAILTQISDMRRKLVKTAMRRIPLDRVEYSHAKKIVAIQRLFYPNLSGHVNEWIGEKPLYLKGVLSQYLTDEAFKEKVDKTLAYRKNRAGKRTYQNITRLQELLSQAKNSDDINAWNDTDKQTLSRSIPEQSWIAELNLESLEDERKDTFQLDIDENGYKEVKMVFDGKGHKYFKEFYRVKYGEEVGNMVKDVLGFDMFTMITQKPFEEWTTGQMEKLAKRINELYIEGRDELAEKKQRQKDEAEEIRERIKEALKYSGKHLETDTVKGTLESKREKQQGKLARLLHGYTDANVRRFARILDNYNDGANVDELYFKENACYEAKNRMISQRSEKINALMTEKKISLDDLYSTVNVAGQDYTIDELLFFLAADKDYELKKDPIKGDKTIDPYIDNDDYAPTARNAVMFGNLGSSDKHAEWKEELANLDKETKERIAADDLTEEEKQIIASGKNIITTPGTRDYISWCHAQYAAVINAANKFLSQEENAKYKELAKAIEDDYTEQFERLQRVSIEEFNAEVFRVKSYVPLNRMESNGDTNENRVKEDLLATSGASVGKNYVDKGMTQKRRSISPLNQKPVELGLYKTWAEATERTEHFINYAGYVRELNRVYKSRDAQYLRRNIENHYGKAALEYIDDYIAEVANPNATSATGAIDNFVRVLRGKAAPAYLSWKASSIIKQAATSPAPYFQFVNPAEYLKACFDIIASRGRLYDVIKDKSVFMANRTFDPVIDLINEQLEAKTNKVEHAFTQFGSMGMQGLEWIDWACVAPGWLACYRKKYSELDRMNSPEIIREQIVSENNMLDPSDPARMTKDEIENEVSERIKNEDDIEQEARLYADDCTRLCQPSDRAVDLAPLFKSRGKNSEVAKAVLQFQTSLNVIWQNIRYDLPYAVRQKKFKQIVGMVLGYTFAGILVNSITEGYSAGNEDDEENKRLARLRKFVYYATTQFTDAVPVIGGAITSLNSKIIGGNKGIHSSGQDLFPMLTKAFEGTQAISAGKWSKAVWKWGEAAGLATGLPVSGTKELLNFVGIGDNDGKLEFKPQTFAGRRD